MIKNMLAAVLAAALMVSSAAPVFAQSAAPTAEKSAKKADTKTAKKLTPQQQKMKDCGAKWQEYKKEKNVKGRAEYQKFLKTCLKG
jgi:outer membrane receptor for monomeric catechols